MSAGPVLLVHGGAGSLESEADRRLYLEGVHGALDAGLAELGRGAGPAVIAAVAHMEEHTIHNAGRGSALDESGHAVLDAGYMDGATRRYGAVTGVRNCMVPVRLAERLAEDGDFGRMLGPPGVDALPGAFGIPECTPGDLLTNRSLAMWERRTRAAGAGGGGRYLDTVGAVALDADRHASAAVSTGGMSLKRSGRIGDSPVVGAGYWADDRVGACVTTGVGEALMREGTARRAVQLLEAGRTPEDAARVALAELQDAPDDERSASGLILVSPEGVAVLDHFSFEMSAGWARPDGEREVHHRWRNR